MLCSVPKGLLILWITVSYFALVSSILQQYFRMKPKDDKVVEGQSFRLHCHVGYKAGAVQWSKDGFLLGFNPLIPGFPRYTMVVDENRSIYNLEVRNVQLEDEGEYQCQVGPAPGNKPIWAAAQITVTVPPREIEIRHLGEGRVVEVKEAERVSLTCSAHDGKPAAQLKWYRNGAEIDKALYRTEVKSSGKLHRTAVSVLTLYPKLDDNGSTYSCEAHHVALDKPMRTTVSINVLYPPGQPVIEGYHEGDVVQADDTLTLACISKGGNPPARLVWYKDDEEVDVTYSTSGREATNVHTFKVRPSDNEATYKCIASSSVTPQPMESAVELDVLFPPTDMKIFGPAEVRSGDTATMTCVTGPSNPPVSITWVMDGKRIPALASSKEKVPGGWLTSSNVSVTITRQQSLVKTFHCIALSENLGHTLAETAAVTVIYPPNPPVIANHKDGSILHAGDQETFVCSTTGGNPSATLHWFKGDIKIETPVRELKGEIVSELTIKIDESDNGAIYRCEATNSATIRPLNATVTPSVYFPPSSVNLHTSPRIPKAGEAVTIICEAASSHPEAMIQWWKDGVAVSGQHDVVADANHGGKSTRSLLHMNMTEEDDQSVVTCRATNAILQRSVHEELTLSVLYKPNFLIPSINTVELMEGQSAVINATARGNPTVISYVWIKDNLNVITSDSSTDVKKPWAWGMVPRGPVLEFAKVNRSHEGEYTCEASNTVGSTRIKIAVYVLYAAEITNITKSVHVTETLEATFECRASANPMTSDLFQWQREDVDETRFEVNTHLGYSVLTLRNVTRADAGFFYCVVFNGIGERVSKAVRLFVKYKPSIIRSKTPSNVAVEVGETAALTCTAEGFPQMRFHWLHNDRIINGTTFLKKYSLQLIQLRNTTWESILYVTAVSDGDLGTYVCVSQNELGSEKTEVKLRKKAHPDTPTDFHIVNATDDTVFIQWTPGFNGGLQQYFRIRYRPVDSPEYIFRDVFPVNASLYGVGGLLPATQYRFSVMGRNALGDSAYVHDEILAETLKEAPSKGEDDYTSGMKSRGGADIPWTTLTVVSAVGVCLLLLNVALVVCFIRRRKARQLARDKEKAEHMENYDTVMYTPNKYHETINGEALFPIGEKNCRLRELPAEESNRRNKKVNGIIPSDNHTDSTCIECSSVPKAEDTSRMKNDNYPDVINSRTSKSQARKSSSLHRSQSQLQTATVPNSIVQFNTVDRKKVQRRSQPCDLDVEGRT